MFCCTLTSILISLCHTPTHLYTHKRFLSSFLVFSVSHTTVLTVHQLRHRVGDLEMLVQQLEERCSLLYGEVCHAIPSLLLLFLFLTALSLSHVSIQNERLTKRVSQLTFELDLPAEV